MSAKGCAGDDMRVLDLFSGIGGFSYGLQIAGGFETVQFVEIDRYCQRVIAKNFPGVPIHDDIRTFRGERGSADLICGGFPCQNVSSAGKREGIEGGASSLWREMLRTIREVRPQFVIVENVAGLMHRGLDSVLGGLAEIGYDAEWHCIPASYVGSPQSRDRIWIVAYPGARRLEAGDERVAALSPLARWFDHDRLGEAQARAKACASRTWRVDDGLPGWVDRIAGLGNAVYPPLVAEIGRAIMKAKETKR